MLQLKRGGPPTPNLEEYKQKNKSKSRRKPCHMQPTNPPTPKMNRPHIHIKANDPKQLPSNCPLHSHELGLHYIDHHSHKKFCTRCLIINNQDNISPHQVQLQKKKELDHFRNLIKRFGLRMEDTESSIKEEGFNSEQRFFECKDQIQETFEALAEELNEKKSELIGSLFESQQRINEIITFKRTSLEEIRCALSRYLQDIENNYQDILEDLSYVQFEQIMDKYNQKVQHFDQTLHRIMSPLKINVYIPKKDIQKQIARANFTFLSHFEADDPQTRTIQRYPTEKHSLAIDCSQRNLESVGGKASQHRQSRDRDYLCQPRKQNLHNYGNIYCR